MKIVLRAYFFDIFSLLRHTIGFHTTTYLFTHFRHHLNIDLHSLHTVSIDEMNNKIICKWSESVSDEDERVGMQVLELGIERDSLNEWVFDRGEIFDIINLLCVIWSTCIYVYYSIELF